ncbi:MAG: hypothetical protein U5L04_09890 [Trueperaceae bacterium]|nr:hypothetical protein [Trueperaceae bacterium]
MSRIRTLETTDDFRAAEEVQRRVWGFVDIEVVPLHTLLTAQKNGGLVLGAFAAPGGVRDEPAEMIGMLFGFLGRDQNGDVKHCSHLMGVVPEQHGRGVGQALKRYQRACVLGQGHRLITWTFDPLEPRNAHLNTNRLGGFCRRYLTNVYGEIRDDLNTGLPTDRFEVEWWIASPQVEARLGGEGAPGPSGPTVNRCTTEDGMRVPLSWQQRREPYLLVEIPPNIQVIKMRSPDTALAWREHSRELFGYYFARGYAVQAVHRLAAERSGDAERVVYQLAVTL